MVQLQTFASFFQTQFQRPAEGQLTDFLSRRQGELFLGGRVNLNKLSKRYGTPLEVVYLPQVTRQVHAMMGWAAQATSVTDYAGAFHYAYATKANFSSDVVRTALSAGAHYETSAAADVEIAHHLWQQGILPSERLLICNGSKEPHYLDAILRLRRAGYSNLVPVIDDLDEFTTLSSCPHPMLLGLREREAGNRDGKHLGNDRFGLLPHEINQIAESVGKTNHTLVMYHAMIGTQVEDPDYFMTTLRSSIINFCELRKRVPTLRYFNYGGGTPTSGYRLDFQFSYTGFLTVLMEEMSALCHEHGIPVPDLIGEFGRYTVANHSAFLFEVGQVKPSDGINPDWYLINGSLMVSAPDTVLVPDQKFVILPLDGWDRPSRRVRLGSRRTCDSDDVYPRPDKSPLVLPDNATGDVIAIFGVGAYQQMISGRGGAHHCLNPEPKRVVVDEVEGIQTYRVIEAQSQSELMRLVGYRQEPHLPSVHSISTPNRWRAFEMTRRPKPLRLRKNSVIGQAEVPT